MCANENKMSYYTNQFQAEIQFELPININNAKSFLYLYKNIFIFISHYDIIFKDMLMWVTENEIQVV